MSNKEQVLSRCKAVVQSGGKCPESGVYVYCHQSIADRFFELCYDGAKLYINADGTGEGFEAAARWLDLGNPWRLTSEELPEEGRELLCEWDDGSRRDKATIFYKEGYWLDMGSRLDDEGVAHACDCNNTPFRWMYVPE